mmetsp:Transcript_107912/g.315510  ORF Transcript_107912/g.315510 Transcript_107912/m.315510 type:complete len:158 (+) Transcript_107912:81-554(+)
MGAACCAASEERSGHTAVAVSEKSPAPRSEEAALEALAPVEEEPAPAASVKAEAYEADPPREEPSPEPRNGVGMIFELDDGTRKEVTVKYRPLGLDFRKEVPLKVKNVKVGSAGEELGIAPGWTIVSIDGKDISANNFNDAFEALKGAFANIPIQGP